MKQNICKFITCYDVTKTGVQSVNGKVNRQDIRSNYAAGL